MRRTPRSLPTRLRAVVVLATALLAFFAASLRAPVIAASHAGTPEAKHAARDVLAGAELSRAPEARGGRGEAPRLPRGEWLGALPLPPSATATARWTTTSRLERSLGTTTRATPAKGRAELMVFLN